MKPSPPRFLVLLAAVATILVGIVLAPFAGALFTAAIAAGVLYPLQKKLDDRLGGRPMVAATLLIAGVTIVAILPFVVLSFLVTEQVAQGVEETARIVKQDGFDGLVQRVPEGLQTPLRSAVEFAQDKWGAWTQESAKGGDAAREKAIALGTGVATQVAKFAAGLVAGVLKLLVDLGVIVLALFAFLSRGDALVEWFVDAVPLPERQTETLVAELRDVTRGVFFATVVTAILQTVVALIGYLIAGTPFLAGLTMLTLLASLVPAIGGSVVVLAVGVLTWLAGSTGMGIFLVAWGLLPVGLVDNLVKPMVAQDKMRMPAAVVLFAMLGGVAVFGPIGVVAGPLVVAFFLGTLRLLGQSSWSDDDDKGKLRTG